MAKKKKTKKTKKIKKNKDFKKVKNKNLSKITEKKNNLPGADEKPEIKRSKNSLQRREFII